MKTWKAILLAIVIVATVASICATLVLRQGFRATSQPSAWEVAVARRVRDLAIPAAARSHKNPLQATPENLEEGRNGFLARCALCHGQDGSGLTPVGRNLYPRVPDLRAAPTQALTDGELHYIIENGVQLTGMPAWGNPHQQTSDDSWKLVLFIRNLRPLGRQDVIQAEKNCGNRALRRLTSLREVSRDDLPALEENPHGQRGTRSRHTSWGGSGGFLPRAFQPQADRPGLRQCLEAELLHQGR